MTDEKHPALNVRLGTLSVTPRAGSLSVTTQLGRGASASASIPIAELQAGAAEYRAEVRIEDSHATSPLQFRGSILKATLDEGCVELRMDNGTALYEYKIERLVVGAGFPASEMVWSLCRLAGLASEHLDVQGFEPRTDAFRVVMPVRGVALSGERQVGQVRLLTDTEAVRSLLAFVPQQAYVDEFLQAGVWAAVLVERAAAFEAEQVGVELIDATLDRLALEAQYSLAWAPDRTLVSFERDGLFADPRAERVVAVRGLSLSRAWLRSVAETTRAVAMERSRISLGGPPVQSNRRFDEAIRAWRRAVQATDPLATVSALWDAIEFYASKTVVPRMFTAPEIRSLRSRLVTKTKPGLSINRNQVRRIDDMVGMLNDPPLLMKLRHALERDQVPFTDEEFSSLKRLREHRNNFEHGGKRGVPLDNDLDLAKAFVNRMLVFWAYAQDAPTKTPQAPR